MYIVSGPAARIARLEVQNQILRGAREVYLCEFERGTGARGHEELFQ